MRLNRTVTVPLAIGLACTTLTSPATEAHHQNLLMPDTQDVAAGRSTHGTQSYQNLLMPDTQDVAAGRTTYVIPPIVKTVRAGGFDWADAAIGAGGATGMLAISLAGAMTLRRRRPRPVPVAS